jgi:S-adenosylmethionine:tRNA ribosyltransferase-isomerase
VIASSPGHERVAPARAPRTGWHGERLLVVDPLTRRFGDYAIGELPRLLAAGDALVVNDAATLPASFRAEPELELRLLGSEPDGGFIAVALGPGDFRTPTEARPAPRALTAGERLQFSGDLSARVLRVDSVSPRLVWLAFEQTGARFWQELYRAGLPIQYAYVREPLDLWDVQNRYAARPWAFELPSAGKPLTFELLFALQRRGVSLARVTHAASISSTGDALLDSRLPLGERYDIATDAAATLADVRHHGGRIVAAGTSVVRALEAAANICGIVAPGSGVTELRLGPSYEPRAVDGLLTGLHEAGTSHFSLLEAFAPRDLLLRATDHAGRSGYLQHEFGDSCLLLPGALLQQLTA